MIIDATNSLTGPPTNPANYQQALHQRELFSTLAPNAAHHRAFCSTGWESLGTPGHTDVPHAGPKESHRLVGRLIQDLGQRGCWLGSDPAAFDTLDGVARLWFRLALTQGAGRQVGFRVSQ